MGQWGNEAMGQYKHLSRLQRFVLVTDAGNPAGTSLALVTGWFEGSQGEDGGVSSVGVAAIIGCSSPYVSVRQTHSAGPKR